MLLFLTISVTLALQLVPEPEFLAIDPWHSTIPLVKEPIGQAKPFSNGYYFYIETDLLPSFATLATPLFESDARIYNLTFNIASNSSLWILNVDLCDNDLAVASKQIPLAPIQTQYEYITVIFQLQKPLQLAKLVFELHNILETEWQSTDYSQWLSINFIEINT